MMCCLSSFAFELHNPICPCCPCCPCFPCFGEGMYLEKSPIPRTLDEYISSAELLVGQLRKLHPPSLNPHEDDVILWLTRSHFLVELRSRQISCIEVRKTVEATKLSEIFPDSNTWITTMIKHTKAKTVQELLTRLGSQIIIHLPTCTHMG